MDAQRGKRHELNNTSAPPVTATVWSNIFNLASFRMSVNQMELNVLVADAIDSSANERGALVLASAVLDLAPTAASFSDLGFVTCLSDVDL